MTKKDLLLNFIKVHGKVSTGELCKWKSENKYDRAQRTCRDFKNLIECRKMTEEEIAYYRPTGSTKFMYEWIEQLSEPIQQEATQQELFAR